MSMQEEQHVDVLIVGAGLSGIGAACHLQASCPGRSYLIFEGRERSGGTWDLFRYPGVRSDSDMYTLGYAFRPWTQPKSIADGHTILGYLRETAAQHGVDAKIRFNHRVLRASWSTPEACWTVDAEHGRDRQPVRLRCNFLFLCSGYYRYDAGYTPEFAGTAAYTGRIVHPQHWPEGLDVSGQRVVVIGSGATAVTLVPALAKTAAHVTLLQRSPTYVVARPAEDPIANRLRRLLPAKLAYGLTRWKNVLLSMFFFKLARSRPERVKRLILGGVRQALGPGYDVATHFTPRYKPWDQRVCVVPDGDLFAALKAGTASMVTDHVDTFTARGIRLKSGRELEADLVVTATGLELQVLGGVQLGVDGIRVDPASIFNYKGMMFSDVPNLASSFGYTNASWTLKSDLTAAYVCRLLNHMERSGWTQCTPRNTDPALKPQPWLDFTSGYVLRAMARFPKQGARSPWRAHQNYARDLLSLRFGPVDDGVMKFSRNPLNTHTA
ncbi:Predicted flavoprotein CzcO associated with the cation diffusion facilitator CzcD [Variovorax sp. OK605]|uniref:flavin-containing monooxygenase n=1 Tax=Variovorax sp. OK605 TaxID=1855317 RepID=UPI0008F09AF3|nr:NAD(P)/FAD-dependent oxidoreductase [Variovorax sp. OK605]SFO54177.1 Predicted flavoprotein CzcO associated with the cation diffusion facilitator CzcD [Variovorax sp. OK605]